MTQIESKKVQLNAPPEKVREFLSHTDNLIHLLPADKVSNWQSDGKVCSFKIQGAYTIGLENVSSADNQVIQYRSTAGSPFSFTLTAHLKEEGSGTQAWQVCDADLNPFLVMIVKDPLRNLFDYMSEKLSERFA